MNIFSNEQLESQKGEKLRNFSQYDRYYNNIEMEKEIQQSPKNFLFNNGNPRDGNQQAANIDELVLDQQDSNNGNQHRRFLSVQLNPQMNFNKQLQNVNPKQQELTNKLPLDAFEEENSIMDQSNQSQSKQDQSSMMSCSRMDKSSNTCLVCFDKQPDSVFMDCGHGGVCYDCALEIWKKTGECYLCRLKIVQVLQVDITSKVYGLIKVISSTQMVEKEVDESDQQSSRPPLEEIIEDNQE